MRNLRAPAIAVAILLAAVVADRWVYDHAVYRTVYDKDWGRLLRILGFWPTWIIAGLALWLHERGVRKNAARRAWLLVSAPGVAGLAAEVLKLVLRRERPEAHAGEYVFRSFSERTFSTGGLALPSSHTMVAFGAAAVLAYLFPRARWVWFALAAGCGLTRVLAHAHFLSDIAAAAVAAIATTAWLWRRFGAERAA